ncbi:MAG TPA: carboxymuconolactone decarboxylase family protein [Acidimicrobiales bacterium]|nr:carboxymuconolactone decarboxylase family protein [Acidimicrobiales bacterium]
MTPRIAPVPVAGADAELEQSFAKALHHDGEPLRLFTTVAHHPRLLRRMISFGGIFMTSKLVPPRDREIVILRTAWRARCEYEFGHHRVIGPREGLSDAEVDRLAGDDLTGLDDDDRALVDLVDEVADQVTLSDATWDRLKARWSDDQILELLALTGMYRLIAGVVNSAGTELEPGIPGWPDGAGVPGG